MIWNYLTLSNIVLQNWKVEPQLLFFLLFFSLPSLSIQYSANLKKLTIFKCPWLVLNINYTYLRKISRTISLPFCQLKR